MKITNKQNLPQAIVNALTSDYQYKDKQFSATTILSGIKSFLLMKRHTNEIEMDASEGINMLLGTAVHNIFESNSKDEELAEEYMKVQLPNGYVISGRLDLYNLITKKLTDYKTCSIWKIKFKDFEDWKKQLLIYAWMLRKQGMEVAGATITALIKDYSKSDYRLAQLKGEYYPESAIINVDFKFTENDYQQIEHWIVNRFALIETYEQLSDDEIPTCEDEERWNSGTKYAVMKGKNVKAFKVFDNKESAEELAITMGSDYWVQERKGIDRKCMDYCNGCKFCKYYNEVVVKEGK